jgi:hypothetical protein
MGMATGCALHVKVDAFCGGRFRQGAGSAWNGERALCVRGSGVRQHYERLSGCMSKTRRRRKPSGAGSGGCWDSQPFARVARAIRLRAKNATASNMVDIRITEFGSGTEACVPKSSRAMVADPPLVVVGDAKLL